MDDLENTIGVMDLYNDFRHSAGRNRRKSAKLRNVYDDTYFLEADLTSDELNPRPISQMDYDEIIAYHLRK